MIQKLTIIASILIPLAVAVAFGTAAFEEVETSITLLRGLVAVAAGFGYIASGVVFGHLTVAAFRQRGIWLALLPLLGVVTVFLIGYRNVHGLARDLIFLEPLLYIMSGLAHMLSDDDMQSAALVEELLEKIEKLTKRAESAETWRSENKATIATVHALSDENKRLSSDVKRLSNKLNSQEKENTHLSSQNKTLSSNVKRLTNENTRLSSDEESLTNENTRLSSENKAQLAENTRLLDANKKLATENKQLSTQLEKYQWIDKAPSSLVSITQDYAKHDRLNGSKELFGISDTDERHIARIAAKTQ